MMSAAVIAGQAGIAVQALQSRLIQRPIMPSSASSGG